MKHRVILVVESPFSQRDRARFGIDDLLSTERGIEVWDVCDLTLPASRRQWFEEPADIAIRRLTQWTQLEELAAGLTASDAVILICGVSGTLNPRYEPLLAPVLRSAAVVGAIAVGAIPPVRGAARARQAVTRGVVRALSATRRTFRVPRGLDFVWAGTSCAAVARQLRTRDTRCRHVHALDYDLVLDLEPRPSRAGFILFLDAMGPQHPDYASLGMANPWTPGCYESTVEDLLSGLDARGADIRVAAHPRAAPGSLDVLYPGREIVHGQTARLMAECSCIVTVEGSTSLGMAAVMGTPVLFVGTECLPPYVRDMAERFRGELRAPVVDASSISGATLPPPVDGQAYERYVHRYVKRPDSPEVHFWAAVARDLEAAWAGSAG